MTKKIILTGLIIISIILFYLSQSTLLTPTRGQAMSMPFLVTYLAAFVLLITAIAFVICNLIIRAKLWSYIAMIVQTIVIAKAIHIFTIFYDYQYNWDKEKHEYLSGTYPPLDHNFILIGIFSVFIFSFCIWFLRKNLPKK